MRRTGTRVRGRQLAALVMTAGLAVGTATSVAFGADTIRSQEWHLDAMHAPEMWQTSTGSGITVAVIDSGVKGDTPDLQGQLLPGQDFSGLSGGATVDEDPHGHGTAMASIIAGTGKSLNGQGAYGLAPGAKILPIKVNAGTDITPAGADIVQELSQGITFAADHGAKVINLSQGVGAQFVKQDQLATMKAAVDHAIARGSLVFAAVGNSGDTNNEVEYPAAVPGVVGIAALDHDGKTLAKSEHGPQVALSAPGENIYAACTYGSGYCKGDGTSDATAIASASAALVWSVHPNWTNNQILRVLINTAGKPQDGSNRNDYAGYGALRPRIALTNPGDPGPADVSPLPAASSPAPSGGASTPAASAPADNGGGTGAVTSSPKKSSSMGLVIGIGVIGVLLLLVLVVVLIVRSRRNTPPPTAGYPGQQMPQQPPYGGYPMQQQPPAPGAYPPPPQGPTPPQGDSPYAR